MSQYEYMLVPISMILDDIIQLYNLEPLIVNGYVYVLTQEGIYKLPQAGRIANKQLCNILKPFGYTPSISKPGLWKHKQHPIAFTLVVDNFGIKYVDKAGIQHLLQALQTKYKVTKDWEGTQYIGLIIAWDYNARTCKIAMPGYIKRALQQFKHSKPKKSKDATHCWIKPTYSKLMQFAEVDNSPFLDAGNKKRIQEVLGTLLYYAQAVNNTMLVALNSIAAQQAANTKIHCNR